MKEKLKRGYTLIEMLTVMVIIGILMSITIVGESYYTNKSKEKVVLNDLRSFEISFTQLLAETPTMLYKMDSTKPSEYYSCSVASANSLSPDLLISNYPEYGKYKNSFTGDMNFIFYNTAEKKGCFTEKMDQWGNPYLFTVYAENQNGKIEVENTYNFHLISFGPDRKINGNEDDYVLTVVYNRGNGHIESRTEQCKITVVEKV